MQKEIEIFEKIEKLRNGHGVKSSKFLGAITSEVIKYYLIREGFNVGERDCFIKGVPNEIDLVILRKGAKPIFGPYYNPDDVLAIIEMKYRGIYTESDLLSINKMFENVKGVNKKIKRIYLTIYENKKHKYRATPKNLNGNTFELFSPEGSIESHMKRGTFYESKTGCWEKLISFLKK